MTEQAEKECPPSYVGDPVTKLPFETRTIIRAAFDAVGYRTRRRHGIRVNRRGWFIKRRR